MQDRRPIDRLVGEFEKKVKTDEYYIWPDRDDKTIVYVSPITQAQSYFVVEHGELCTCDLSSNCSHVQAVRIAAREEHEELSSQEYREIAMRERKVLFSEIEDAIECLRKSV